MRGRGIICIAVTVAIAAAFAVPGALASSSQQIRRDYAKDGRIDGHYSRADLRRALRDAQGKPSASAGLRAAIQKALDAQPTRSLSGSGNGPSGGLPFATPTGGLPFTGFDPTLLLLGGLGLLTLGAGLRKLGRAKI